MVNSAAVCTLTAPVPSLDQGGGDTNHFWYETVSLNSNKVHLMATRSVVGVDHPLLSSLPQLRGLYKRAGARASSDGRRALDATCRKIIGGLIRGGRTDRRVIAAYRGSTDDEVNIYRDLKRSSIWTDDFFSSSRPTPRFIHARPVPAFLIILYMYIIYIYI